MRIFFILLALVAATWVILDRFPTEQDKYPGYTILRWATDANPARWDQIRTFNELHEKDRIRVLLQPRAGVATDVQLSGRRGPDLVDIYSPTAFFNYASQGVLLDVTDRAERGGIGVDDVWPAVTGAAVTGAVGATVDGAAAASEGSGARTSTCGEAGSSAGGSAVG